MLKCRWCGTLYENTDLLDHTDRGWWCDACEGFTHFNLNDAQKDRFLLILEDKQENAPEKISFPTSIPSFRKRLSPLRYPGGKSKLIDYLYTQLSQEKLTTFSEVFAGGASLGLSLLDAGVIEHLILNDKDPAVFAFWKTVLDAPFTLVERLHGPLPSHKDYFHGQACLRHSELSDAELAWSFLLVNRLSFSGIVSAGPTGGKNGSQEALLSRWNPKALEERILHIHSMKDKITLFNLDYTAFLEEAYWHGGTLFVDPPYIEKADKLYTHYFTMEDHKYLAELLQTFYSEYPDPDILVTYDNHPVLQDLYPLADQKIIPRKYSISKSICGQSIIGDSCL